MIRATRLSGAALAMLGMVVLAMPALADVFTVSKIPVDVTAGDAVAARDQAIVDGQRAGLTRLLQRLTSSDDWPLLPSTRDLPIDAYVRSLQIASEELSPTRYIADLTVGYDPKAVGQLLNASGLAHTERRSAPLVVLPLAMVGGAPELWIEEGAWYEAWADTLDPDALVHLVLPLGDLEDVVAVSAGQALGEDPQALAVIAERYGASGVLIARARLPAAAESALQIPYEAHDDREDSALSARGTVQAAPTAELSDVLADVVRTIQQRLDEQWKRPNLLRMDRSTTILVEVVLSDLAQWVRLSEDLQGLPEVKGADVETFARRLARIRLEYLGDLPQFQAALGGLGLELAREGETWRLQRAVTGRGSAPEAGAPASSI